MAAEFVDSVHLPHDARRARGRADRASVARDPVSDGGGSRRRLLRARGSSNTSGPAAAFRAGTGRHSWRRDCGRSIAGCGLRESSSPSAPFLALGLVLVRPAEVRRSGCRRARRGRDRRLVQLRASSARSSPTRSSIGKRERSSRDAEALTSQTDRAARWLSRRTVIAPFQAAATTVIMLAALGVAVPNLRVGLRRPAGQGANRRRALPRYNRCSGSSRNGSSRRSTRRRSRSPHRFVDARSASRSVTVSLANGRVRLALDSSIPEVSGRSILLAPAHRPPVAGSLDLHPGRHSRALPAAGVQAGLAAVERRSA